MRHTNKKPKIDYPCRWEYRIIGSDSRDMKTAVRNTISATDLTIRESRTSRTGKYVSLSVNTTVASDEERVGYCERLQSHPAIRYVL